MTLSLPPLGLTCFAALLAAAAAAPASAKPATRPLTIDFARDVQPILMSHCYKCHGEKVQKGKLRLDVKSSALRVKDAVLLPGNAAESDLYAKVVTDDLDDVMPPPGKGDKLKPAQAAVLKAWIDEGAHWPDNLATADVAKTHWAYQKVVRPELPAVKDAAWPRNPLDRFVLAKLEAKNLHPSPEADKVTLLRRASLDLIGLPPTPADVDTFLADTSATAYEAAIDRLLASPHYGERWARPWLDLARYADTNGFEKDNRRVAWPWRDWVIKALNDNVPFDRFTVEQLAGDLLPDATPEQRVATGFHRNTMLNEEGGVDVEEYRVETVVDRASTTATVWLGMTMACAHCHDHKYDPVSQRDFFSFFAYFNSQDDATTPLPPTPEFVRERAQWAATRAELEARVTKLTAATRPTTTPATPEATVRTATELKAARQALADWTRKEPKPVAMVLRELAKPRETRIHLRGNFLTPGDKVAPGTPAILPPFPKDQPANRLGLARWIVAPENPLTARVTMNRLWEQYFGRGIVATVEDFGTQAEPPTNQPLLDWLAAEFVRTGWDVKAMHKLIVTSATYRQSSHVTPQLLEADPANFLHARAPRLRVEAESVRDIALVASGLFNPKVGGPSVMPPQPPGIWRMPYSGDRWANAADADRYRRGLYTFWRRTAPYPMMLTFDAPARDTCTARRPRTNTPLQALATLNDEAFVECAQALARRMLAEAGPTPESRIAHGFRLATARAPDAREAARLAALYRSELDHYRKDPAAAKQLAGKHAAAATNDVAEAAAWTVLANVLLNLDETVTKG